LPCRKSQTGTGAAWCAKLSTLRGVPHKKLEISIFFDDEVQRFVRLFAKKAKVGPVGAPAPARFLLSKADNNWQSSLGLWTTSEYLPCVSFPQRHSSEGMNLVDESLMSPAS